MTTQQYSQIPEPRFQNREGASAVRRIWMYPIPAWRAYRHLPVTTHHDFLP